jgi:hypothetical protein
MPVMVQRHKKTRKTNLTASKKKQQSQSTRTAKTAEALSELADCHYRLMALVSLLESCGETLEAWQVSSAGSLVGEQVRRLEELMNTIDKETR